MSLVQDESTDSYFLGLDLIETGNARSGRTDSFEIYYLFIFSI